MPDLKLVVNNNTDQLMKIARMRDEIEEMRSNIEVIDFLLAIEPKPSCVDAVFLATKRDKLLYDIAELEKEVDSPESDTEQALRFC